MLTGLLDQRSKVEKKNSSSNSSLKLEGKKEITLYCDMCHGQVRPHLEKTTRAKRSLDSGLLDQRSKLEKKNKITLSCDLQNGSTCMSPSGENNNKKSKRSVDSISVQRLEERKIHAIL